MTSFSPDPRLLTSNLPDNAVRMVAEASSDTTFTVGLMGPAACVASGLGPFYRQQVADKVTFVSVTPVLYSECCSDSQSLRSTLARHTSVKIWLGHDLLCG